MRYTCWRAALDPDTCLKIVLEAPAALVCESMGDPIRGAMQRAALEEAELIALHFT